MSFSRRHVIGLGLLALPPRIGRKYGGLDRSGGDGEPPFDKAVFIDVREFGASGKSSAGDGRKINDALRFAIRNGRPLYLPSGRWLLDDDRSAGMLASETRDASIFLFGDGPGNTILVAGSDPKNVLHFRNAGRVSVRGLSLDCSRQSRGSGLFCGDSNDIWISNIEVIAAFNNGILIDGSCRGVRLRDVVINGARNPLRQKSGGHGVALSGNDQDGVGAHVSDFSLQNIRVNNPNGSGLNISEAEDGQISDIEVVHDGREGPHDTGYGALRLTNGTRRVTATSIRSVGMSRGLVISECNDGVFDLGHHRRCGMEGILVTCDDTTTARIVIRRQSIENPGQLQRLRSADGIRVVAGDAVSISDCEIVSSDGKMPYGLRAGPSATGLKLGTNVIVSGARLAQFDIDPSALRDMR